MRYRVTSRPATSRRLVRCGSAKPSYTGTMCVTPSPESTTTPDWRPARRGRGCWRVSPVEAGRGEKSAASERRTGGKGGRTLGIECEDGLDCDVDAAKLVILKHDLGHLLAVLERVHRGLGEEDLAPARVDLEFLLERVVPQDLHVVPVLDDAVVHGLRQLQERAVLGRLVPDHDVLDGRRRGALAALLGAQDRATDQGRESVRGEVCGPRRDSASSTPTWRRPEQEPADDSCRRHEPASSSSTDSLDPA